MGEMTHKGNQDSCVTSSREQDVNIKWCQFASLQRFFPSIAQQSRYTFRKSRKLNPKARYKHWSFARYENKAKDLRRLPENGGSNESQNLYVPNTQT